MSDRDPEIDPASPDWIATRALHAREILRRMVGLAADKTTDLAPGPMALPKGAYIDPERFEAERQTLFLGQPIVAGLTGDIPEPGDVLVFDAAGPSILVIRGKSQKFNIYFSEHYLIYNQQPRPPNQPQSPFSPTPSL